MKTILYSSVSTATSNARFGQGQGQIWLESLQCDGSESSLHLCPHRGVGRHDCGHHEDAGVICPFGMLNTFKHSIF